MQSADDYQAKYSIVFLFSIIGRKEFIRQLELKLVFFLAEVQLAVAGHLFR